MPEDQDTHDRQVAQITAYLDGETMANAGEVLSTVLAATAIEATDPIDMINKIYEAARRKTQMFLNQKIAH